MRNGTIYKIAAVTVGLQWAWVGCGNNDDKPVQSQESENPAVSGPSGGNGGTGNITPDHNSGPAGGGGRGGSGAPNSTAAGIGGVRMSPAGAGGAAGTGVAGVAGADANAGNGGQSGEDAGQTGAKGEKIGVLFLGVGTDQEYSIEWAGQFMANLFDYFPAGFFAGGRLEGGDCYTLIHYANEVEAAACHVAKNTPIDAFCNEYKNEARYPVQALNAFWFLANCYADIVPFFALSSHSTVNPSTGAQITAPVVTDPSGTGMGIADFIELSGFSWMERFSRLPGHRDVHREQLLRWWYGNDASGYEPEKEERPNIKDKLQGQMPNTTFAFRHGWESYMENKDLYGAPKRYSDSTETAIRELIVDEKVDKIVVFHAYPGFANMTQFGHEWYEPGDVPISAVDGKTFAQCVADIDDAYGPKTADELNSYLTNKPWKLHDAHPFPLIRNLVAQANPQVGVSFAPAYGEVPEFADSIIELIRYTVEKQGISSDASLKVILAHHGFAGGYVNSQQCDSYHRRAQEAYGRIKEKVVQDFSWKGRFELVHAAGEFAEQANAMAPDDPVSTAEPFGTAMSIGEEVEKGMNGAYVNALGEAVDNGTDNFQYIVIIPYYFESESSDTLYGKREYAFGNNHADDLNPAVFVRDTRDSDGSEYNAGDVDSEYFSVKRLDQSGWPGTPGGSAAPVLKGSATAPTTVIVTGTFLSITGNPKVRENLTEAAVKAIRAGMERENNGLCKSCPTAP